PQPYGLSEGGEQRHCGGPTSLIGRALEMLPRRCIEAHVVAAIYGLVRGDGCREVGSRWKMIDAARPVVERLAVGRGRAKAFLVLHVVAEGDGKRGELQPGIVVESRPLPQQQDDA